MKKLAICLMMTCMSLAFLPLQSNAATTSEPTSTEASKPAEVKALELRLSEISAMDKSKLAASEKKNLRKEVKTINHKLKTISGGVYIGAGALILIVVLLIILL
jgi:hypothetical protein